MLLLCIFAFSIASPIVRIVTNKINATSGVIRLAAIINEIQIFINNPIIGNGFMTSTIGSSNSFFALLADGGVLLWSLYFFPIIAKIIKCLGRKRISYTSHNH